MALGSVQVVFVDRKRRLHDVKLAEAQALNPLATLCRGVRIEHVFALKQATLDREAEKLKEGSEHSRIQKS